MYKRCISAEKTAVFRQSTANELHRQQSWSLQNALPDIRTLECTSDKDSAFGAHCLRASKGYIPLQASSHSALFVTGESLDSALKGLNALKRCLPDLERFVVHTGTRRSTPIRACLQKGWQEADAAAPSCSHREARGDTTASGSMASTLTLLLALGGLTCLATAGSASAAELQDKLPHLHPVAADLNQLAESVSTFLLLHHAY